MRPRIETVFFEKKSQLYSNGLYTNFKTKSYGIFMTNL